MQDDAVAHWLASASVGYCGVTTAAEPRLLEAATLGVAELDDGSVCVRNAVSQLRALCIPQRGPGRSRLLLVCKL